MALQKYDDDYNYDDGNYYYWKQNVTMDEIYQSVMFSVQHNCIDNQLS